MGGFVPVSAAVAASRPRSTSPGRGRIFLYSMAPP